MNLNTILATYKHQKWILGISGGADSMALLDLAYQQGLLIEVVHVHYHQRLSADRDCAIVEAYCQQKNVPFHRFDAPRFRKGNFQMRARNYRYQKFKAIVQRSGSLGVMLAHHMDDVIETYLFQQQRQSKVDYYGIKARTWIKHMRVERPLLSLHKTSLVEYCIEQGLNYGLDESNLSDQYERNRIRKHLLALSLDERTQIYQDMLSLNCDIETKLDTHRHILQSREITEEIYQSIMNDWSDFLSFWLRQQAKIIHLSHIHVNELHRQLSSVDHMMIQLNQKQRLIKQHQTIRIASLPKARHVKFNDHASLVTTKMWFKLSRTPRTNAYLMVVDESFTYQYVYNAHAMLNQLESSLQHKIRRLWIKNKVPYESRENWPLFFNHEHRFIGCPLLYQKGCFKTDKNRYYVII
jgi:tRNA(Ile)-lysidine synthetase-like protein